MSIYTERFEKIHNIFKEYGCKSTYSFKPEYQCPVLFGGFFFYRSETEMHLDQSPSNNWEEKVVASLDVVVPTLIPEAKNKEIRFDIEWSQRADLYSMYISLPTTGRSISLSSKLFKTQDEVISEIMYWLKKARCKRQITKEQKPVECMRYKQLGLF